MRLGDYIRQRRKELGLSQFDLAEKADLTTNFISSLERNMQVPSVISLSKLADGLDVPATQLLELLLSEINGNFSTDNNVIEYQFVDTYDIVTGVRENNEGPLYCIKFAGIEDPECYL